MPSYPAWSRFLAMGSIIPVVMFSAHRLWWPSRMVVSTNRIVSMCLRGNFKSQRTVKTSITNTCQIARNEEMTGLLRDFENFCRRQNDTAGHPKQASGDPDEDYWAMGILPASAVKK